MHRNLRHDAHAVFSLGDYHQEQLMDPWSVFIYPLIYILGPGQVRLTIGIIGEYYTGKIRGQEQSENYPKQSALG